jgi:hypothetical protein
MSLTDRLRFPRLPRLALGATLLAAALAAGGCIGGGDAFAGPDCEEPITPIPTVPDTSSDSTRADPPADPSPDLNPCSAPDV